MTVARFLSDGAAFSIALHLTEADLSAIEVTFVASPLGTGHLISYISDGVLCSVVETYHHVDGLGVSVVTVYRYLIYCWFDPVLIYTLDSPNKSSVSMYVPIAMCCPPHNESAICILKVLYYADPSKQVISLSNPVLTGFDKEPGNSNTGIKPNKNMLFGCANLRNLIFIYARQMMFISVGWQCYLYRKQILIRFRYALCPRRGEVIHNKMSFYSYEHL